MNLFLLDVFACFISTQFLLPIILAIEWNFSRPWLGMFIIFLTAEICGCLMYLSLVFFGVSDGISGGPGPRSLKMRLGLLIGLVLGSIVTNYITKPIFYKIYAFIQQKKMKNKIK